VRDYTEKLSDVKDERRSMIKEAKQEAFTILDQTKRLAERLVKEIRERDKEAIKKVREIIDEEMESLVEKPGSPADVKAMDTVYVKSLRSSGVVTEVSGELARVDVGEFKVTVPLSDLEMRSDGVFEG
jgi:DNA mismatch repair protein MutS2